MYQTMSPENVPSSSLRKSNHFKSSKLEDQISPESRTIILTQEQQQQQQHQTLNSSSQSRDVLLQWGQRKRSRCSRTENRSMANSNSNSNSSEKHHIVPMPTSLPHPCSLPSTSRVRPNNGLLHSKDTNAFSTSKNRSIAGDEMGCTNGTSPSRNGSRTIGRSSIAKRSPSRKVKSDDSLGNGNHHNHHHHHRDHAQIESTTELEINNNGGLNNEGDKGEVVEWPRIFISLSRKEKEDDFYAMKGTKLPHRPKKRPKAVDRALQYCFPGLWLSDLTRARYEVRERKSAKKPKRRGLKGLENMESESE